MPMSALVRLPLKRLTVCPCGYGVLHDDIAVGTEYWVDLASETDGVYQCGRCGAIQKVRIVDASSKRNPNAPLRPLIFALFADAIESRVQ
jgi:hypothetical protein